MVIFVNGSQVSNHTLDAAVNELKLEDLSDGSVYSVVVAAYNRQGVGPFSPPVELIVDDGTAEDSTLINVGSNDPDFDDDLEDVVTNQGHDLIAQEVWFAAAVSGLTVFVLIGFFVAICIKKRSADDKTGGLGGHYNGKRLVICN